MFIYGKLEGVTDIFLYLIGALEIDDVNIQDVGSYRCNASSYGQYRLSNKAQLGLLTSDVG